MKKAERVSPLFMFIQRKLLLNGRTNGASVSASAAADALISVDNVLAVSLGDAANRTTVSASAAADAFVSNLESHREKPPFFLVTYILSHLSEKSSAFSKKIEIFGQFDENTPY